MNFKKHFKYSALIIITIAAIQLTIHTININNQNTPAYKILFSPNDQPKHTLIDIINQTSKEIMLAVYNFTSTELAEALINARKRGVKIQVVADKSATYTKSSQIEVLKNNGIEVLIFPTTKGGWSRLMHNKFALFKIDLNKKLVCTGSMNWTRSGLERNRENTIIFSDEDAYKKYENEFKKLQKKC